MNDVDRSELGSGHRQWIRSAVDEFEGPLLRYANQFTGDLDISRDVVQETFLRLCDERESNVGTHLAQWLFTVCRTRAIDHQRKENRMKTMTADQAEREVSPGPSQSDLAEQGEETERVERMLADLSENQQEVVRLRFQNGLSYKEISSITNLKVSNVGYLLHTAIQKIRSQMNIETS